MKQTDFDVVVVGGGHAGCEAADAAYRMGASTCLITLKKDAIGVMSCNPAIGGLGKGHLVREVDAMDGLIGRIGDASGIQYRLLNRRKGPAVQGPRIQADRDLYRTAMQAELSGKRGLFILEGEVVDIFGGHVVQGVELADGSKITTRTVVLTTGTFLGGVIHIGDKSHSAGRMGEQASRVLSEKLREMVSGIGRLKTGTPPRLDGKTINWDILDEQAGDPDPTMLSFMNTEPRNRQVSCYITHTSDRTHDIIRRNLQKSAMYSGLIEGKGPRYCPSIEDKVTRFADKSSHQVFLEPEGLRTDTVYPNGISTSLPHEVQIDYVRSMMGLENAVIQQPGYAIEYDYVDPRSLTSSLQLSGCEGLFLAGQINGTTGYEEAASQGLVAGLNAAALALGRDPVTFSRTDSYIGVMIDDLVSRGVTEPYRMFTSRAEYRLSLRADNADQRLTQKAIDLGCVTEQRKEAFLEKMERLAKIREKLEAAVMTFEDMASINLPIKKDGKPRNAFQVLGYAGMTPERLFPVVEGLAEADSAALDQVAKDSIYHSYIARQENEILSLKKDEARKIPEDFDFGALEGLSNELKEKLRTRRPENLAQASRIEGMTPAATVLLLSRLRSSRRQA